MFTTSASPDVGAREVHARHHLTPLAVFSWAVIVAFALGMHAGFRTQDPPLSPFQSIVIRCGHSVDQSRCRRIKKAIVNGPIVASAITKVAIVSQTAARRSP